MPEDTYSSKRILAVASVACPHKSTSIVGVNHRMAKGDVLIFTKAVSDRLFSEAIDNIMLSGNHFSRGHTAAGLPPKHSSVKAST